jgi:outer membrane immunogenic protein
MRSFLVASVSSAALATTAWAAPPPKAMRAQPMALPTWAGFYAGLDLGWLGNQAKTEDLSPNVLPHGLYDASMTVDSVIAGGHFGYNWQFQPIVLGVEADISGASGSRTISYSPFAPFDTFTSKIDWLSTFRGRFGVAFDQWLVYGTAGLAVASVHNTRVDIVQGPFTADVTKTKSGFVWGGGVERMFGANWSARVEVLAVDLGDTTETSIAFGLPYITHFSNKAVVARGGVSYKW